MNLVEKYLKSQSDVWSNPKINRVKGKLSNALIYESSLVAIEFENEGINHYYIMKDKYGYLVGNIVTLNRLKQKIDDAAYSLVTVVPFENCEDPNIIKSILTFTGWRI